MIVLTDEMRRAIADALDDGCPVISSSVDGEGQPSMSFYGSTQVHSDDQLAIWVRNPAGDILRRIAANPRIAFLYRNPAQRQMWQFHGRARVVDDAETRTAIYDGSHKAERDRDPERLGVAVVVDLDRVLERGAVLMER
ncbi:MAG: pyridoxamine 5'-phosphate oxidase family protein [Chloroflexi bacterium]|nr:pyridoxamine 5'-phosphate oxidase family protein [Chloroflexota bacterium]